MSNQRIIVFDCEFGGVQDQGLRSYKYSILEIGAIVMDVDGTILDQLDLRIGPSASEYVLDPQAIKSINFDLNAHKLVAKDYNLSKTLFLNFLKKNSQDGKIKLIPLGKKISFDVTYLQEHGFIDQREWQSYCSFEEIDLGAIVMLWKMWGNLPPMRNENNKTSNSLWAIANYLKLPIKNQHNAFSDVVIMRDVYLELKHINQKNHLFKR